MGFNRDNYKSTSAAASKEQAKVQQTLRPSSKGAGKVGYHDFDEGDNIFRIFPFHPNGEGKTFSEAKTTSFLTVPTPVYEDGEKTDKVEWKRRGIFNAKVHGVDAKGLPLELDMVEAYMDILKAQLNEIHGDNKDAFKKDWGKATHYKTGVKPSDTWLVYANKLVAGEWVFGLLELKKSQKDGMNEIAAQMEGEDDILSLDPFSDPDTGLPIVITKDSDAEPAKYYKVSFKEDRIKKTTGGFTSEVNPVPLTDAELEELEAKPSLHKKMRGQYTESDFQLQMSGLERFDTDNGFGIFNSSEFEEVLIYLGDNVQPDPVKDEENAETPEADEELKKEVAKPKTVAKKKVVVPDPEPVDETENEAESDLDLEVKQNGVEQSVASSNGVKKQSPKERLAEIRARVGSKK